MLRFSSFICILAIANVITIIHTVQNKKTHKKNIGEVDKVTAHDVVDGKRLFLHVNTFLLVYAAVCTVHHIFFEIGEASIYGVPDDLKDVIRFHWRPSPGIIGLPLLVMLMVILKLQYGKRKIKGMYFFTVSPLIINIGTIFISLVLQAVVLYETVCVYFGHGHLICLTDILVGVSVLVSWLLFRNPEYIYGGALLMLPAVISIYVGIYMVICLPCFQGEELNKRIKKCKKANRLTMIFFVCFFIETFFWEAQIYWPFAYVVLSNLWTEFCLWRISSQSCQQGRGQAS